MSKLGPAEMAQYFEERLGWAVTTAWNLTVKDVEQTISGVCQQVGRKFLLIVCRNGMFACLPVYSAVYCREVIICKFAYTSSQQMRPVYILQIQFRHSLYPTFCLLMQAHNRAVSTLICLAPVARIICACLQASVVCWDTLMWFVSSQVWPCRLQWQIKYFLSGMHSHKNALSTDTACLFRWSGSLQRETTLGICVQRL